MWKEVFESKVIRVEGTNSPDLVSQLIVGTEEIELLDPYNQDRAFQLPLRTCVKIVIKSKNHSEKYSVSFNTSLIIEDGVHWLPLFKDKSSDFLTTLPEEVRSPRVLMLLHKKVSLDIIKECEKSEISSACEEDYMPEIKLCSSLIEISNENQADSQDFGDMPNISINFSEDLQKELKENLEKMTKLFEVEKIHSESLKKELETAKTAFLAEIEEGRKREKDLLDEFKNAESRYAEARFDITRLKHELKSLQSENSKISASLAQLEQSTARQVEDLQQKVRVYETSHSNSDNILAKLSEFGQPDFEVLREKEEVIKSLSKEISSLKSESFLRPKLDDLDEAISKFNKSHRLQNPFIKDREQIFIYNNKKVSICLKEGSLFYRVGAVLKPLDDIFTTAERPKTKDEESKSRLSPARKSLKSTQSTSRSPKRTYT